MPLFVDIHSHSPPASPDILTIQNLLFPDIISFDKTGYFSAGIHPWHIEHEYDE
ncbi:MAG: hypothetical protein K8R53_16000 [Bacteroidales bacterium]|nr:hypothetical protein [Bacteroidales bacterium]